MISTKDLYSEIGIVEDVLKDKVTKKEELTNGEFRKHMLKIAVLHLKLLHNIRTNQTSMMEKMGAAKVKPKREGEDGSKSEEKR